MGPTNDTADAGRLSAPATDASDLHARLLARVAELQQMEYEAERRLLVIRTVLAEYQALITPPPPETAFGA